MQVKMVSIFAIFLLIGMVNAANWYQVNPRGMTAIQDVFMVDDSTVFIVGDGGVMKSVDGGYSWRSIDLNYEGIMWDIEFVNANLGFIAADNVVFRTRDGGQTWENVLTSDLYYTSVFFLDENHGWVTANQNQVLKTSDGGNTWTAVPVVYSIEIGLSDVFFISPDTGWVVGEEETIFKTTNGGQTWELLNQRNFAPQWNVVVFNTDSTGWVGGDLGTVLKSYYGDVWSATEALTDSALQYKMVQEIVFPTETTGFLIANNGVFAKTTDGGKSWNVSQIPGAENDFFYGMHFYDDQTGMIVGYGGVMYKTPDGGTTWQKLSTSFTTDDILDGAVGSTIALWMVTRTGKIYGTFDGGQSWNMLVDSPNNPPRAICYAGGSLYAVGANGLILFSGNSGISWITQNSGVSQNLNDVQFASITDGWAVGEDGVVLKTTDGGQTWSSMTLPITETPELFGVFAFSANRAVVAGQGVLYQTLDGGASWSGYSNSNLTFYAVTFTDSLHGWAAASDGKVYATTDGGANWVAQTTGTSNPLYHVEFWDFNLGWAVGANGTILQTVDGGAHWEADQSPTQLDLNYVAFPDTSNGWVLGNGGTVLNGNVGTIVGITHSPAPANIPASVRLLPNFPNPFNPSTTIGVQLNHRQRVRLDIFNLRGQKIRTLWVGELDAGTHSFVWDGRDDAGRQVSSGMYVYQLRTSRQSISRKMILIK